MFPNAVPHGIVDGLRDEVLLCRVAMFEEAYKKKKPKIVYSFLFYIFVRFLLLGIYVILIFGNNVFPLHVLHQL